jgi:hypothetical protein
MGVPKGGGYQKVGALNGGQKDILSQILGQSGSQLNQAGNIQDSPLYQQAAQAIQGFLPGGEGFNPIQEAANKNFQQQTIPSILNSFGTGTKGSSALNQALAAGASNLNTNLASQLAQMQLQAAGQAAGLSQMPYQQGIQGASLGLGTQPHAFTPRAAPFWQDLLLAGISGGSQVAGSWLGKAKPIGAGVAG